MANKRWTEEEVEILYNHYKEGWDSLLPKLPDRTKAAIKLKLNSLGLTRRLLTDDQKQYILDNYKTKTSREIAKDLGYKSKSPVLNFLNEEGLQRLSDSWLRKDVSSGVSSEGYYVEIVYEMDDRRQTNE